MCVVKPYRGVASDGVYLCRSKQAAKEGFEALLGQPQFGGGLNEAVLIQVRSKHDARAHWTLCVVMSRQCVTLWILLRTRSVPHDALTALYLCIVAYCCAGSFLQEILSSRILPSLLPSDLTRLNLPLHPGVCDWPGVCCGHSV